MEEIRIDVRKQTASELELARTQSQLLFRFNHTMPAAECSARSEEDLNIQLGLDSCGD